jgi:hypothetical protein
LGKLLRKLSPRLPIGIGRTLGDIKQIKKVQLRGGKVKGNASVNIFSEKRKTMPETEISSIVTARISPKESATKLTQGDKSLDAANSLKVSGNTL